jgi:3-oxoacyl-[acyl-carrier protein] reductase
MLTLDLSAKVAVITGATSDLGRVMVRTLSQCGANIAINYLRNAELAATLVNEVEAAGRRAIAVQADITSEGQINAMRDRVLETFGSVDIVVNNAVIQYDWKSVLEQDLEDYEGQFRSCVLHNVLMAKAFVPSMIERGHGGRVIGINTECAMQNFASQSAYVSGKRGMDGVLRILAKEIGEHQITVNQVAPGWTISARDRAAGSEIQPGYTKSVPLARRGTDQEIANVVAFLASDLSSYITGAYIPVCGGNVMPTI